MRELLGSGGFPAVLPDPRFGKRRPQEFGRRRRIRHGRHPEEPRMSRLVTMPRPARVLIGLGAAAACIAPALAAVAGADAAAATGSSITVPSSPGKTAATGWTGTIPPGANANSDCNG